MRNVVILILSALLLPGCASTVALDPAEYANDPGCAEVSVRIPDQISDLERRPTNAQATAAWGEPAAVIYRCGLQGVEVSALPCVTAGGVDWLVDESNAPSYRFITFARFPATELIVDSTLASGVSALEALASAVEKIPNTKQCSLPN